MNIYLVFSFYNKLFDHLEKSICQLRQKKVSWKQLILSSLETAQKKLSKYYSMTNNIEDNFYTIGTILAPANKLQFFSTKDWEFNNQKKNYKKIYRQSLESFFGLYSQNSPEDKLQSDSELLNTTITDTDLIFENSQPFLPPQQNKLTKYLESRMYFCLSY